MKYSFIFLITLISFSSCKKEKEIFEDNDIPLYEGISTLQVENYVNRIFIDLIGREPLNTEMALEVSALENANLAEAARTLLIEKLQQNTDSIPGDSSYFIAYNRKIYEDTKARLIEGVSNQYIIQEYNLYEGFAFADSINGNFVSYELNKAISARLMNILNAEYQFRQDLIEVNELYARMLHNSIYDDINMNTFNFINASFDNLYYRFPTQTEFDQAYPIIENNSPGELFGEIAQNKSDYVNILTANTEFNEGLVSWAFLSLLAREPLSNERFELINLLAENNDLKEIQLRILITDEYAGF